MTDTANDKRFQKIIKKMKKRFAQKQYYEGQQMLKTIFARLSSQGKYAQTCELLSEGAMILMKHSKVEESVEIVNDLIQTWKQMPFPENVTFDKKKSDCLHTLLCMIPVEDTLSMNNLMKYLLKWTNKVFDTFAEQEQQRINGQQNAGNAGIAGNAMDDSNNNNNSDQINDLIDESVLQEINLNLECLYKSYGLHLYTKKQYHKSVASLVRTSNVTIMVDMFAEWSQKSNARERPYFVTRIVLKYLFVGNVQTARKFITQVCPRDEFRGSSVRHPLENFSDLLIESIERKSVVLYNVVRKEYIALLRVDHKLIELLNKAANVCLGIPLPQGKRGLLGNLMSLIS